MIIYTDLKNPEELYGSKNVTPAHVYAAVNDFSVILEELAKGNIPSGTGQPFDVNWNTEENENFNNGSPWLNQNSPSGGFINPMKNI